MIHRGRTMPRMSAVYLCLAVAASALAGCAAPPYPNPSVVLGHFSGAAAGLFAGLCLRARGRPEWPHTLCARPESLPCTGPDRASVPGTAFATGLRQRIQPSAHGRAPVRPGSRPPARRRSRGSDGTSGAGIHLWRQGHPARHPGGRPSAHVPGTVPAGPGAQSETEKPPATR